MITGGRNGAGGLEAGERIGTILLVEDEDGVRLLTRMILERAGYRVILAASAEEAEQTHLQFAGRLRC